MLDLISFLVLGILVPINHIKARKLFPFLMPQKYALM